VTVREPAVRLERGNQCSYGRVGVLLRELDALRGGCREAKKYAMRGDGEESCEY